MMTRDVLIEDAQRMEDIATECGRALRYPYRGDDGKFERFMWAVAVAILHLLQTKIKEIEK